MLAWPFACVFFLQRGSGVEVNHQLALELFRRAADLGDPQAQGMMGMRMAVGLHHYGSFEGASIRMFVPVRHRHDCGAVLHRLTPAAASTAQIAVAVAVHLHIWAGPGSTQLARDFPVAVARQLPACLTLTRLTSVHRPCLCVCVCVDTRESITESKTESSSNAVGNKLQTPGQSPMCVCVSLCVSLLPAAA